MKHPVPDDRIGRLDRDEQPDDLDDLDAAPASSSSTTSTTIGSGALPDRADAVVYFTPGFEASAARMAADLDLLPEFIAPIARAPQVLDLPADAQLVAYIGLDRA